MFDSLSSTFEPRIIFRGIWDSSENLLKLKTLSSLGLIHIKDFRTQYWDKKILR